MFKPATGTKKANRQRQHSRKPLPDHLDRHDQVLSPGDACNHCGGALKKLGRMSPRNWNMFRGGLS